MDFVEKQNGTKLAVAFKCKFEDLKTEQLCDLTSSSFFKKDQIEKKN